MSPLRTWRGQRTLDECAALIGTTPATLSRLERGEQWVSRDLAERLVKATGLSLDALLVPKAEAPTTP